MLILPKAVQPANAESPIFFNEIGREIVANEVGMVQEKFKQWYNSPELERILNEGKMKAEYLASKKMNKLRKKFGYGR